MLEFVLEKENTLKLIKLPNNILVSTKKISI